MNPTIKKTHRQIPVWLQKKQEKQRFQARRKNKLPFAAWDGEGVVHNGRKDMSYVLFGCVTADTNYAITGKQLTTDQCLEHILTVGKALKDHIHVSFAFTFDVDQILRDLDDDLLHMLKEVNSIRYDGYLIKYIPRKFFEVTKKDLGRVIIYDAFTFFACSFLKACEQYLPKDDERLKKVKEGKDARNVFTYDALNTFIKPYWILEGQLMVDLMNALRHSMISAGISLDSWHGPGAVASSLIRSNRIATHIKTSRQNMPEQVLDATAHAYFGGRFECFQFGYIEGPIYSYDLRSAYPAALSKIPGLMGGHWEQTKELNQWGLYKVRLTGNRSVLSYGPFPFRAENKTVSYGLHGVGWYYGHEVIAAKMSGWPIDILDGWIYVNSERKPFAFVEELYHQRAIWKREGNPAQLAAKLGMNSIYGKLCQTVGWNERTGEPPRFHNQWYAGHITSWCRAQIQLAIAQNPAAIIAVETDGIYSTEPLNLKVSDNLGDWEKTVYDDCIYVQNGVYFLKSGDKWIKERIRGIGGQDITVDYVSVCLPTLSPIETTVTRYASFGGFIGKEKHHSWYQQKRAIVWGGEGKRRHIPEYCPCAENGGEYHRTVMARPVCGESSPRFLPWV